MGVCWMERIVNYVERNCQMTTFSIQKMVRCFQSAMFAERENVINTGVHCGKLYSPNRE